MWRIYEGTSDLDLAALRNQFERLHGYWSEDVDAALNADPHYFAGYLKMADVSLGSTHLDPKVRALVMVVANASVTLLKPQEVRRNIKVALNAGATKDEVREALELASSSGIHAYWSCISLFMEQVEEHGFSLDEVFPKDVHYETLKKDFIATRGVWSEGVEAMARPSPAFFEGYTEWTSAPWRNGSLTPAVRELLYLTVSIQYGTEGGMSAMRLHMKSAFDNGATPQQILQVMQIVSCLGLLSVLAGAREII